MNRSSILYLVFILTLIFTISCSGGGENVIAPSPGERDVVSDAHSDGMLCSGLWQFVADKATGNVDLVQLRSAEMIANVLGFMEPPPLTSMDLDWEDLFIDFDNNVVDVGVILSHPIPDDVFSGFDVRGVCFGPKVTNPDGLTILTGPEYFSGEPFGYLDGLLGAPDSYGHYEGLAGYKYFCGDIDEDDMLSDFFSVEANYTNRGMFPAIGAGGIQRNYHLEWNDSGHEMLVFNYAIYANYDWPIGEPPWDVDDWSITAANSAEAFCFTATETANNLWWFEDDGGGDISLEVEIWDWQGDISGVTIETVQAGVIPQTSFDTAYDGSRTFSTYMFDFNAIVGVPTSAGDLDILITVTDAKTFSECWFMNLLSTGNEMFDTQVFNCFIYTVDVAEEPPAGDEGLNIKSTGPLPATLPAADERNFCVVANDLFDEAGVYYFTNDVGFDVSYYDLTYSGVSTLKGSIQDPFFGNIGGLLINVSFLGSIECPPMGGVYLCNRSTAPMTWGGYNANGPVWWCSPADFPNLTNGYIYFNMAFVDLEYVYADAGPMWGFWRNFPAGVDGATYYSPAPYTAYYSITGYFPVDHTSAGVDGQISELFVKRFGFDTNTNSDLLTAPCNMMWYYIENDPGNPSVEVAGNADTFGYFQAKYTIDDEELVGLPIDVATLNNYEDDDFPDVEFNWACILEDYEDGTWCVSVWEWDGTAMQLIDRTDPIDGAPYNLDCDTVNQEIHVWADDSGTDNYWIFEWVDG